MQMSVLTGVHNRDSKGKITTYFILETVFETFSLIVHLKLHPANATGIAPL